jgi:hypothetical protein
VGDATGAGDAIGAGDAVAVGFVSQPTNVVRQATPRATRMKNDLFIFFRIKVWRNTAMVRADIQANLKVLEDK